MYTPGSHYHFYRVRFDPCQEKGQYVGDYEPGADVYMGVDIVVLRCEKIGVTGRGLPTRYEFEVVKSDHEDIPVESKWMAPAEPLDTAIITPLFAVKKYISLMHVARGVDRLGRRVEDFIQKKRLQEDLEYLRHGNPYGRQLQMRPFYPVDIDAVRLLITAIVYKTEVTPLY